MPLVNLLHNNERWAESIVSRDPEFFKELARQQTPEYLWIGCADSRVPANEIVGLKPGELFVHRNIANLVKHDDMNCQSVIQYAVDVLKVKHIIVTGHYGCGGVAVALSRENAGISDYWLRAVKDCYIRHRGEIDAIEDPVQRLNRMCEINVVEQVAHVVHSKIIQHAWQRGQSLRVHGWIYDIKDGILKDLGATFSSLDQVEEIYRIKLPT